MSDSPRMTEGPANAAGPSRKDAPVSHRNLPNPEFQRAMHGLGSSSATQAHQDRRTKRARTRSAAKSKAIRDWS